MSGGWCLERGLGEGCSMSRIHFGAWSDFLHIGLWPGQLFRRRLLVLLRQPRKTNPCLFLTDACSYPHCNRPSPARAPGPPRNTANGRSRRRADSRTRLTDFELVTDDRSGKMDNRTYFENGSHHPTAAAAAGQQRVSRIAQNVDSWVWEIKKINKTARVAGFDGQLAVCRSSVNQVAAAYGSRYLGEDVYFWEISNFHNATEDSYCVFGVLCPGESHFQQQQALSPNEKIPPQNFWGLDSAGYMWKNGLLHGRGRQANPLTAEAVIGVMFDGRTQNLVIFNNGTRIVEMAISQNRGDPVLPLFISWGTTTISHLQANKWVPTSLRSPGHLDSGDGGEGGHYRGEERGARMSRRYQQCKCDPEIVDMSIPHDNKTLLAHSGTQI